MTNGQNCYASIRKNVKLGYCEIKIYKGFYEQRELTIAVPYLYRTFQRNVKICFFFQKFELKFEEVLNLFVNYL